jgi:hypothetical protein
MPRTYDFSRLELPDERVLAILRTKSTIERFQLANEANKTARALVAGYIKTTHPDWTDSQIDAEVARRMLHGATGSSSIRDSDP